MKNCLSATGKFSVPFGKNILKTSVQVFLGTSTAEEIGFWICPLYVNFILNSPVNDIMVSVSHSSVLALLLTFQQFPPFF